MKNSLTLAVASALSVGGGAGGKLPAAALALDFMSDDGATEAFDLLSFARASTATYFDSTGVMQTAANGVPRINHEMGTGARRGLLIEESRTNLLLHSEDMANAAWDTGFSITSDDTTAPDGELTADKLSASTVVDHYQTIAVTASKSYVLSYFVKRGTKPSVRYAIYNVSTPGWIVSSTETVPTADEWVRVEVPFTTPVGCTSVRCYIDKNESSADDGYSWYWGTQCEAGECATSYIPTTTAAGVRGTEYCYTTDLSWYTQGSAGTLYAKFSVHGEGSPYYRILCEVDDGSLNNRHALYYADASDNRVYGTTRISAAAQCDAPGVTAPTANVVSQACFSFETNGFRVIMDGELGNGDTAGAINTATLTRLYIGGPVTINGHIQAVKYWPSRLPYAFQQSLTS
jgi:hypothetical protein